MRDGGNTVKIDADSLRELCIIAQTNHLQVEVLLECNHAPIFSCFFFWWQTTGTDNLFELFKTLPGRDVCVKVKVCSRRLICEAFVSMAQTTITSDQWDILPEKTQELFSERGVSDKTIKTESSGC